MNIARQGAVALVLALAGAAPVLAASGSIDSFSASALSVTEGTVVDFVATYTIRTDAWITGGSNTDEPAPEEGYQEWIQNWYDQYSETVRSVSLQAGDQSFSELPSVPAGTSHSGSWAFSLLFPVAGTFDVSLGGNWEADVEAASGQEIATRNCYNQDTEGGVSLWCDSWSANYPQFNDNYTWSESLGPVTLSIEVLAAQVPEPQTLALWLAGFGLLVAHRRLRKG